MPIRHANANWEGSLKQGNGRMRFADYEGPFTFGSRFEEAEGTNPEELIGAAISGCFSMALSGDLGDAGHNPQSIRTEASVEVHPQPGGGFAITKIHLKTEANVPGIDDADELSPERREAAVARAFIKGPEALCRGPARCAGDPGRKRKGRHRRDRMNAAANQTWCKHDVRSVSDARHRPFAHPQPSYAAGASAGNR